MSPEHLGEEHLRDGFEVRNADAIFESTFEKNVSSSPRARASSARGSVASSAVPWPAVKSPTAKKKKVSLKQILLVDAHNERVEALERHRKRSGGEMEDFSY